MIHNIRLPFLESICWQTDNAYQFTEEEMLSRYERGWRYRDIFSNLEGDELKLVKDLVKRYNSWLDVN